MRPTRRQFMAGFAAGALAGNARAASPATTVTPEMFGARGDGRTNDTDAFSAMSAYLNALGGGTISLRRATYVVGKQRRLPTRNGIALAPVDIVHLVNCRGPIVIQGNGAVLRCVGGLRYGRFDPQSGRVLADAVKFDLTGNATPYTGMIHIEKCSGPIIIADLELDGNVQGLEVGGRSNRAGWLAGGTGIRLVENTGPERLSNIHSHHHAQDGLILTAAGNRAGLTEVSDFTAEYNGRQGCSITGGHNYVLQRCRFRHTGRTPIGSSPGAGVDIEAESSPIRNVTFSDCEFSDNHGFGLVSGTGDSADIVAENCRFVGTTNLAAWPESPGMRFANCLFVGSLNHLFGDADPSRAAQFLDCTFTDNPGLSPTGRVFLQGGNWIAIARPGPNVRFARCHFRLVGEALLPLTASNVIYEDCDMAQRSPRPSAPIGTFFGTNSITGNATLQGSIIRGTVRLNGRQLPRNG